MLRKVLSCFSFNKPDRNYHFADDGFFNQNPPDETVETPVEKIKLGEKEYTQADLQKLVGLGEIGLEAEQKYKTRIDRVWPQFQTVINEKKELQDKLTKIEADNQARHQQELEDRIKQVNQPNSQPNSQTTPPPPPPQFTPEQVREIALKQAEELGIGPNAIRKVVTETLQGQQLIHDITGVIDDAQEAGWVKSTEPVTVEDVLSHMQETGIRNPLKALRDMKEDDYINVQAEKLASIKRGQGLPTISQSNAGGKVPPPVRITSANLEQMLGEALNERAQ